MNSDEKFMRLSRQKPSSQANENFMRLAIKEARRGVKTKQSPFGACIVRRGKLISSSHSTVLLNHDATCHAEVNAIHKACRKLKSFDLSDCIIFSTTEPCPMCFSAIHWARIPKIFYGTSISDAKKAGFNEICISDKRLENLARLNVRLIGKFLHDECLGLFKEWHARKDRRTY